MLKMWKLICFSYINSLYRYESFFTFSISLEPRSFRLLGDSSYPCATETNIKMNFKVWWGFSNIRQLFMNEIWRGGNMLRAFLIIFFLSWDSDYHGISSNLVLLNLILIFAANHAMCYRDSWKQTRFNALPA